MRKQGEIFSVVKIDYFLDRGKICDTMTAVVVNGPSSIDVSVQVSSRRILMQISHRYIRLIENEFHYWRRNV